MDSMPVRELGFREVFKDYDEWMVEKLLTYHKANGGLSRYVKIAYFYREILQQEPSEADIQRLANEFSEIMKRLLVNPDMLIKETVDFIVEQHKNYNFHVVSGSDGKELNYLCDKMNLSQYFISIHGSPTPKSELTHNLIEQHGYDRKKSCLIGDSGNDRDAAENNNIAFIGFNKPKLKGSGIYYIDSFKQFKTDIGSLLSE